MYIGVHFKPCKTQNIHRYHIYGQNYFSNIGYYNVSLNVQSNTFDCMLRKGWFGQPTKSPTQFKDWHLHCAISAFLVWYVASYSARISSDRAISLQSLTRSGVSPAAETSIGFSFTFLNNSNNIHMMVHTCISYDCCPAQSSLSRVLTSLDRHWMI